MTKQEIIDSFKKLSDYEFKSNRFKGIAFRKSMVMIINSLTYKIIDNRIQLINSDQSINILGASSSEVFIDLITKGHSDRVDLAVLESSTADLNDLINISGIGEVKKSILIKAGIDTVKKLYDLNLSMYSTIPGTNITYTPAIDAGLKLFIRTQNKRIDRDLATAYCRDFKNNLINHEIKNFEMYVLGSYRRMKPTVGDIDIILVPENGKEFIGDIRSVVTDWFDDIFMDGYSKKAGVKGNTQVDVKFVDRSELGTQILHGTGSGEFNKMLRGYVKSIGYSLSENGIKKDGKLITFSTEREVFKFLKLQYIEPQNRSGDSILRTLV